MRPFFSMVYRYNVNRVNIAGNLGRVLCKFIFPFFFVFFFVKFEKSKYSDKIQHFGRPVYVMLCHLFLDSFMFAMSWCGCNQFLKILVAECFPLKSFLSFLVLSFPMSIFLLFLSLQLFLL